MIVYPTTPITSEYHKIQNIYKRDEKTNRLIDGQYYDSAVEYLAGLEWIAGEKIDGTNIRVIWDCSSNQIEIKGRTDKAELSLDLLQAIHDMFDPLIPILKEKFPDVNLVFYGEGYGPGIQKGGGNYRSDKSFILYDILINESFLNYFNMLDIATNIFSLPVVPELYRGTLPEIVEFVKDMKSSFGDFDAEGVVARPIIELKDKRGKRLILKIKRKEIIKNM